VTRSQAAPGSIETYRRSDAPIFQLARTPRPARGGSVGENKAPRGGRPGLPRITYGLALYVGDVIYGKIGSDTRLDFTDRAGGELDGPDRIDGSATRTASFAVVRVCQAGQDCRAISRHFFAEKAPVPSVKYLRRSKGAMESGYRHRAF
jgi:hypothetical protein